MGVLSRAVFREILTGTVLGSVLFVFVLFLQQLGELFEILIRSSASAGTVGYVFALLLAPALTIAVPLGVLVGVLLGLNRMSADGEIVAMRAAGMPTRRILVPVSGIALLALSITAASTIWLTPASIRESYRVLNGLFGEQLTAEIQPRVFEESFPNTVLYVGDVDAGSSTRWHNVFMADLTPAAARSDGGREYGDQPRITVADEAVVATDTTNHRIQLSTLDSSTYEAGRDPSQYYVSSFPKGEQTLEAQVRAAEQPSGFNALDIGPLLEASRDSMEARMELHRRFSLPLACVLLALIGVPLGISTRKSGRSAAFVLTIFVAFLYYMGQISLIGMAQQGRLPVEVAVWTPNALLAIAGIILMRRLERTGERDLLAPARWALSKLGRLAIGTLPTTPSAVRGRGVAALLPQIVDTYVLGSFLFYLAVLLTSFVAMTHVFTFFELLGDIVQNNIPLSLVLNYHFYLTPMLVYDSAPVSVLVAVLVTFGVLSKHHEVTAMKACGVSMYRLATPVLLASALLSVCLFAFDQYVVPEANRIQDAIRNQIKGRPVQTFLRPDRKWIFGTSSRIYYYRYFDPNQYLMVGLNVYDLDPDTFQLQRHISVESARWEPSLGTWILQNGWVREFEETRVTSFENFSGEARTFRELDEPPSYFLKEVKQDEQMNFFELSSYIGDLRQSGFDTARLNVQLHKKFSVPLIGLIMALLATPFAFLAGHRGAMAGVGISIGIAVAYWGLSRLFEQIGNLNQLPAIMAAWSPNAIFCLVGMYLFARMRS